MLKVDAGGTRRESEGLARAVLFLVVDGADITGHTIDVDGGVCI
jgi:hypothetical protein